MKKHIDRKSGAIIFTPTQEDLEIIALRKEMRALTKKLNSINNYVLELRKEIMELKNGHS